VTSTVADAYTSCRAITKDQARNFYYGIRLLPADKRDALCAVYALARRIDDIGDGDLPIDGKTAAIAQLRVSLDGLGTSSAERSTSASGPVLAVRQRDRDQRDLRGEARGSPSGWDPVMVAVADAGRRYPIPLGAFEELVDGVEMDIIGRTYATFDELVDYCRCVAGSVGRLCLGIFGSRPHPEASRYADTLGIALQQTNILRDIREDLLNGRVYLPKEDLHSFGVELALDEHGALVDKDGSLSALIRFSARRAQQWYAEGLRLAPLLDRRSGACCTAMAGIYRRLLEIIAAEPSAVFAGRLSLSGRQKLEVAVRALSGRAV
jgi:15-cis-phytoene synthase